MARICFDKVLQVVLFCHFSIKTLNVVQQVLEFTGNFSDF